MPVRRAIVAVALLSIALVTFATLRGAALAAHATDVVPLGSAVGADDPQAGTTLRVGIKPLDPFVTRSGSRYSGFSIELWDEIARRNNWTTNYVWHDTLPPLLDDVAASKLDIGIAGISITREREARLDFSHPMFNAGLQVMTQARGNQSLLARMSSFATASLGLYLLALIGVIFIAGNVVWLFQRQHGYLPGVGHGMFKAATVGLVGEVGEPGHPLSRAAAVVWIVLGICFVSMFTASLTTELTVRQITGNINGVNDLVDKRVVAVKGSTAREFLAERRIDVEDVDTAEAGLSLSRFPGVFRCRGHHAASVSAVGLLS